MSDEAARSEFVQAFERGLAVLLSFEGREQNLSEVAAKTGMSPAAARRYLSTLTELGYFANDHGRFRPKAKLIELSRPYFAGHDEIRFIQNVLQDLSRAVGESASLTLLDGAEAINVLATQSPHELSINVVPGNRLPLYCTSMGRAMMAQLTDDEVLGLLAKSDLRAWTPKTVTDAGALLAEVRNAREQGYALIEDEYAAGIRNLSMAFRLSDGNLAALSVPTPTAREGRDAYVARTLEPLRAALARVAGEVVAAGPLG